MCTKIHLSRLFAPKDLFQVQVRSQKELLFTIIFGFYLTCVSCRLLCCLIAPLWFCTIFQQDSTSTPWGVLLGKLSPVWTILSLNWRSTFSNSLDIVHTGYVWVSLFFYSLCWPCYKIDLYLTYLYFSLCPLSQTLWMKCSEIPSSRVLCTAELRLEMRLKPFNLWPCGGGEEGAPVRGTQPSINSEDLSTKRQNIACVCPVL